MRVVATTCGRFRPGICPTQIPPCLPHGRSDSSGNTSSSIVVSHLGGAGQIEESAPRLLGVFEGAGCTDRAENGLRADELGGQHRRRECSHALLEGVDGFPNRAVHLLVPGSAEGCERCGEIGDGGDVVNVGPVEGCDVDCRGHCRIVDGDGEGCVGAVGSIQPVWLVVYVSLVECNESYE